MLSYLCFPCGRPCLWVLQQWGLPASTQPRCSLVDVFLGRRIVTTLSFAPGYYHKGASKNLGYDLEFRSQLEISYRLDDRSRLGLSISHMSNASIGDKNPGTENLMVTYAIPGRILFGNY